MSSEGRAQTATLRRLEGAQAAGTGEGGQVLVEGAPVSMGREAQVTQAGDYRFFAGWRSDPFFLTQVPLTTFSSLARTTSPIKTFAASRWKCRTLLSGRFRWACGPAR